MNYSLAMQTEIGAGWENAIDEMARSQGFEVFNMDPNAGWSPGGFRKSRKSPFDRLIIKGGKAIVFDAKTTIQKKFYCDKIKKHQLDELMRAGKHIPSGYLIYYRLYDRVVWYNWQELFRVFTGQEKYLKPEQGIFLGTLMTFKLQPIFDLR